MTVMRLTCFLIGCSSIGACASQSDLPSPAALAQDFRSKVTSESRGDSTSFGGETYHLDERNRFQMDASLDAMKGLLSHGQAANDEIRKLIDDPSADVRKIATAQLDYRQRFEFDGIINSRLLVTVNIPLLEHALTSDDSAVRCQACLGISDSGSFGSKEVVNRVAECLPKLKPLFGHQDGHTRDKSMLAYEHILFVMQKHSSDPAKTESLRRERETILKTQSEHFQKYLRNDSQN
jgi:hypothetical protein